MNPPVWKKLLYRNYKFDITIYIKIKFQKLLYHEIHYIAWSLLVILSSDCASIKEEIQVI